MSPIAVGAATDTLVSLLDRAATFPATGLRFVDRRERARFLAWSEVSEQALRIGRQLAALGITPGERIALVYPTEPDFIAAFFGVLTAGAVPVPLYPPVRLGRLDAYHRQTAAMIDAAGCRLVLASATVRRILGETIALARPALGCRTLESIGEDAPESARVEARQPTVGTDDLGLVQFSSGTTTEPKPVALSHRALLAQTRALNDHWRDPDSDNQPTGVSWLPLYHDMGLIGCVLTALELPSVMTLLPPEAFVAKPALWLRALGRYSADITVAPNFAYALAVAKVGDAELDGFDLSPWRYALCGAEPVSPGVLRDFQTRFAQWGLRPEALTPVYGLSEAALAITFGTLDQAFQTRTVDREDLSHGRARGAEDGSAIELVSAGRPLEGFAVAIVDAEGDDLPVDTVGRIRVAGPSLMDGYLDRPDLTAQALQDGWLDTGDVGFLDVDGRLFLTGRAKDVVIVRGRNHDPAPIEQAASALRHARAGCAVAVSHAAEGAQEDQGADTERLVILVEHDRRARRAAIEALADAVTDAVLGATGLKPDHVAILAPGTLPRTSSGKLRRQVALRRYLDGSLAPPGSSGLLAVGGAMLRSARAFRRVAREEKP